MPVLARLRQFSRERLPLILGLYIVCQPLLDILTAFGVTAGHPITAGVVVRSLFMALAFLYVMFVSQFPGKKLCLAVLGAFVAYLVLFMGYMFSLGGLSLCLRNLQECVKTFYTPFVLVFLYTIYKEYGHTVSTRSIAWAGAIYCGVILLAFITNTSFKSYGNSGYGYNGWFYAANETGCIIALAGPFVVYYCIKQIPAVTRKTWWKVPLILWALASVMFSANYIGTKIVFLFNLVFCVAALVWMLFGLYRERTVANLCCVAVLLVMCVATMGIYLSSPLKQYINDVYDPYQQQSSEDVVDIWESSRPIKEASEDTWLRQLIKDNKLVGRLDAILSRRLFSASPSVQVFIDSGPVGKLLGIGYRNTPAYNRDISYMIEMDPPSILIRHGVLGFAIYVLPYFAFIVYAIIQFLRHPLKRLADLQYCTYLYTTLAALAIALIAGHALVSPGVSIFLVVVSFNLWVINRTQNLELKKA